MTHIKTLFIITVATAKMFFPNIPILNDSAQSDKLSPFATAQKSITLDLTSSDATKPATMAQCTFPDGLKAGKTAKMVIEKSKPEEAIADDGSDVLKVKTYWSSAEMIPEGQPKIIDPKTTTAPASEYPSVEKEAVYAYWPGPDVRDIAIDADAPGNYALTTNFCGSTAITLDPEQNFLNPVELINAPATVNFDLPITLTWKPIKNAIAYSVSAFGGTDKEVVTWTSSAKPDLVSDFEYRAIEKSKVEALVKDGVLLGPDVVKCVIPAGVFKGSDGAMVTITALGVDKIQDKDDIRTEVVVRSALSMPLMVKNKLDEDLNMGYEK